MPTNLVPASSTFTTTDMLAAVGDQITATFLQNLADNTGFNWTALHLGMTNLPQVSFGINKTIDYQAAATTTTITFASDKVDGVDSFTGAGTFACVLMPEQDKGDGELELSITSQTASSVTVTGNSSGGLGTGTVNVMWIAFGY